MRNTDTTFITIQDLLSIKGLSPSESIKLIRHASSDYDLYQVYLNDRDRFFEYQSHQGRDSYQGADFIVSFIGEAKKRARFIGVFRKTKTEPLISQKIDPVSKEPYMYQYELIEDERFIALRERIIIDWGRATRTWCQDYRNEKEVLEIHPGLHYKQFTDYLSVILTYQELTEYIDNEYLDWKTPLSCVNGIYMIVNSYEQKQYIGSTYGSGGIWSRWNDYIRTGGTGGNQLLKECKTNDPNYTDHLTFTILDIMPITTTQKQAVDRETLLKTKFGTRAIGLNAN